MARVASGVVVLGFATAGLLVGGAWLARRTTCTGSAENVSAANVNESVAFFAGAEGGTFLDKVKRGLRPGQPTLGRVETLRSTCADTEDAVELAQTKRANLVGWAAGDSARFLVRGYTLTLSENLEDPLNAGLSISIDPADAVSFSGSDSDERFAQCVGEYLRARLAFLTNHSDAAILWSTKPNDCGAPANSRKEWGKVDAFAGYLLMHDQRYDEAVVRYGRALDGEATEEGYVNRGLCYAGLKRYDDAISNYDSAIKLNSSSYAAYNNRGNAHKFKGDRDKALADFNRAVAVKPGAGVAHANIGLIEYYFGRHLDRALKHLRRAINLEPRSVELRNAEGIILRDSGRLTEAKDALTASIQALPKAAVLHNNRGLVFLDLGMPSVAIQDFDKAIETDGNLLAAVMNRANAFMDLERYEDAIRDYGVILQHATGELRASTLYNRALAHQNRADWPAAAADLEAARKERPTFLLTYPELFDVYRHLGKPDLGTEVVKQVWALPEIKNPLTRDAYRVRGLLKKYDGDYPGALDELQKAIDAGPGDSVAIRRTRFFTFLLAGNRDGAAKEVDKLAAMGVARETIERLRQKIPTQ
jgi:tetratricopeptide (TPR) repeat protein